MGWNDEVLNARTVVEGNAPVRLIAWSVPTHTYWAVRLELDSPGGVAYGQRPRAASREW